MRKSWGTRAIQPGEEQAQEGIINVYKYLRQGNEEEEGARLFSVAPADRDKKE